MSEEEILDKTIDLLSQLDGHLENLKIDNIEKLNIYTKTKELIFWLSYYKEFSQEDNEEED